MSIQTVTNEQGKETAIIVTIEEWRDIQKRLNDASFYHDFDASLKSIKDDLQGKIKLKNARTLIHEL